MKKIINPLLGLVVFATSSSLFAAEGIWPPAHMKDLPPDYLGRLRQSLEAAPSDRLGAGRSITWVRYAITALANGERVDEINAFFESPKFESSANPKFGFSLFSTSYVRLYGLYNNRTGVMKGVLSEKAQERFEKSMWEDTAAEYCRLDEAKMSVWAQEGSENHHMSNKVSTFLMAQFYRNIPAYKDRRYNDGSTPAEQYEAYRLYFHKWIDEHARRGQFVEDASTSYQSDTIAALFNLRDFAEDPALRKKTDMYIDLVYANIAEETLLTTRGGPKSRVKKDNPYDSGFSDERDYNLIFNAPGREFKPAADPTRTTSNYYPLPVIVDIAKDTTCRGAYVFAKRWPGPIAVGGAAQGAEGKWLTLDPEVSILRYGYATPDYVLGSAGIDTTAKVDPESGRSQGNRWQGVVFADNELARIGFEVEPARNRNWHGFNPFISVQDRNILVTRSWAPAPPNDPRDLPAYLRVYFSPTLDEVVEEGGWIFVRSGNAYAGVKVVTDDYVWVQKWKHDKTASNDNSKAASKGNRGFIKLGSDRPVITVVNQASDYQNSFEKFKAALKKQPIEYKGGVVKFATITFSGAKELARINGNIVNLKPNYVNKSPFIRSEWGSGLVYIRKGDRNAVLDFRDPNNPVKTVDAPMTDAFPPGMGNDAPIIFNK